MFARILIILALTKHLHVATTSVHIYVVKITLLDRAPTILSLV